MRQPREDLRGRGGPIRVPAEIETELQRRLSTAARGWLSQHDTFIVLSAPMLLCSDGLRLSVQSGPFYASIPGHSWDGYTHVEVAFASRVLPAFLPYSCGRSPAGRICARVPVGIVVKAIANARGLMPALGHYDLRRIDAAAYAGVAR